MSKCSPFHPPFLPHLLCSASRGSARGGCGAKGRFPSQAWGEGDLLLAGPQRTAMLLLCKPSVPGYFSGMNQPCPVSPRVPPPFTLGHRKAAPPRSVPRVLTERGVSSRDSGRPGSPLPGHRTKGHPLTVTASDSPDSPEWGEPRSREEEPGSPLSLPGGGRERTGGCCL